MEVRRRPKRERTVPARRRRDDRQGPRERHAAGATSTSRSRSPRRSRARGRSCSDRGKRRPGRTDGCGGRVRRRHDAWNVRAASASTRGRLRRNRFPRVLRTRSATCSVPDRREPTSWTSNWRSSGAWPAVTRRANFRVDARLRLGDLLLLSGRGPVRRPPARLPAAGGLQPSLRVLRHAGQPRAHAELHASYELDGGARSLANPLGPDSTSRSLLAPFLARPAARAGDHRRRAAPASGFPRRSARRGPPGRARPPRDHRHLPRRASRTVSVLRRYRQPRREAAVELRRAGALEGASRVPRREPREDLYVKVPVDEATLEPEVEEAARLVGRAAPGVAFFLQPILSPDGAGMHLGRPAGAVLRRRIRCISPTSACCPSRIDSSASDDGGRVERAGRSSRASARRRSTCWSSAAASTAPASRATRRCAGCGTVLVEKGDFAHGTSSRSSKLIHGGLRYLEHGRLRARARGLRASATCFGAGSRLIW